MSVQPLAQFAFDPRYLGVDRLEDFVYRYSCLICKSFKMSSPKRRIETDVSTPPLGTPHALAAKVVAEGLTLGICPHIGHEVRPRTAAALIPDS